MSKKRQSDDDDFGDDTENEIKVIRSSKAKQARNEMDNQIFLIKWKLWLMTWHHRTRTTLLLILFLLTVQFANNFFYFIRPIDFNNHILLVFSLYILFTIFK